MKHLCRPLLFPLLLLPLLLAGCGMAEDQPSAPSPDGCYRDILLKPRNKDDLIIYSYDQDGWRSEKYVNGVTTTFVYRDFLSTRVLVSEERDGRLIDYFYDTSSSFPRITGFLMDGQPYQFQYDSTGDHVVGILDYRGQQQVTYEYTDQMVTSILEKNAAGEWIDVSDDPEALGCVNRIRAFGQYWDEETGWYYRHGYYTVGPGGRFLDDDVGLFSRTWDTVEDIVAKNPGEIA